MSTNIILSMDKNTISVEKMKQSILNRLNLGVVKDLLTASTRDIFHAVSQVVLEWLSAGWLDTQRKYYESNSKRVYYISMEFLLGKSLKNNLINLGLLEYVQKALSDLGYDLDDLCRIEEDAGLGNGGLGRLAACYLDSMATLGIPGYGYGIRYDYGIFSQKIENGYQIEYPDNWLRYGDPWEIRRGEYLYSIRFYGSIKEYIDGRGKHIAEWIDTEEVMAMAYDVPIQGYGNQVVNSLRLWQAQSSEGFNFTDFNHGNYVKAIESMALKENISRVLYPNDSSIAGLELRLKQEYFLVSATIQDIIRRYTKSHITLDLLPEKVVIQLNDTHPALAIAEFMHILVDREEVDWNTAWNMVVKIFNYTNHTILPEALERWSVDLFKKLLPRHFQIITEINKRWLNEVEILYPNNIEKKKELSILEEKDNDCKINMAKLSIIGSNKVNGVSILHSKILKTKLFPEFFQIFPNKFLNVTNGITQRRWLKLCNPNLSKLIDSAIGDNWCLSLNKIKELFDLSNSATFIDDWRKIKKINKSCLSKEIFYSTGMKVNPESLFDCHIKRIHEYKRQLLNILRVIHVYLKIKDSSYQNIVPRTIIFSGKAAPGYFLAKLIIKLINSVANIVNNDRLVSDFLKVIFLPNYSVSLAERIIPAADLSEQISVAGTEASGTGNMKFALNGAITIGTLDGSNIEMRETIGQENMFIFGLQQSDIDKLRPHYFPRDLYNNQEDLKRVLDLISEGFFSEGDKDLFRPILDNLLNNDTFFVLQDFQDYILCQKKVDIAFSDKHLWSSLSIKNTAGMYKFSSDESIMNYARNIWNIDISHCV